MAKGLNKVINMTFNADTEKAKRKMQELQNALSSLTHSTTLEINVDAKQVEQAISSAAELRAHLQSAFNTNTGNLDFAKLNQSIKQSGKTLSQYADALQSLGPDGQHAFTKLAQAIAQSEVPMRRTNALVKEFATTLANTARWQLSSSVLHGFMGALQSAYGYAQDLNESLNNIRIVTGQNIEQMAEFAKEANKAARALSSSTTDYTNASLIYYQQGLSDEEVKKRTDVTIKMANVSRQSAAEVSNQMTSIWNNFYDGSKSLEHYADVLTALGAATASSTEEIAGGLEKFAAVADTIGLSYEYAAAALATITSNTRESEEVVGTALKTIFARIQGLNLGETLDDGTTMNKYSAALAKVGINILDASGNLKTMDTLLDEMGDKWNTISKAQQVALAQTVAGTRQYNQLIALMDNWNAGDSDSFMANLSTANASSGILNKQAETYAEGWEGASKRVRAAAESIYEKLINDDFFIDVLSGIEKILGFVDNLIDKLGGLKGVLMVIGTIVTKVFSQQLATGIQNMAYNIQMMTATGRKKVTQERNEAIDKFADRLVDSDSSNRVQETQKSTLKETLKLQNKLLESEDKLSEIEKEQLKILLDRKRLFDEQAVAQAHKVDIADDKVADAALTIRGTALQALDNQFPDRTSEEYEIGYHNLNHGLNKASSETKRNIGYENIVNDSIAQIREQGEVTQDTLDALSEALRNLAKNGESALDPLIEDMLNVGDSAENIEHRLKKIESETRNAVDEFAQEAYGNVGATNPEDVKRLTDAYREQATETDKLTKAKEKDKNVQKQINDNIEHARGAQKSWGDTLISTANVAMAASSAISMLGSIFDTLKDPDLSGWQKFVSILGSMALLIPTLITLWSNFKALQLGETLAKIKNVAATMAQVVAEKALKKAKGESTEGLQKNTKETIKDTKEKLKNAGKSAKETIKNIPSKIKGGFGKIKDKAAGAKKSWDKKVLSRAHGGAKVTEVKGGNYAVQGHKGIISGKTAGKAGTQALKAIGGGAALIAAGVVVAAAAITVAVKSYKKYEKAAADAAKTAKQAADAYESVAETYNKFKSTLNDYKSAKDGLKELTKGTVEYKEAVINANEEARKLIEQNKEWKNGEHYTINKDGLIEINQDALEAAQNAELNKMQSAQINKDITQLNADRAKTKSDTIDFLRDDVKSKSGFWTNAGNIAASTLTGAGSGALIGAGVGSLGAGVMAAPGAIIGAIAGGITGLVTGITAASSAGSSTDTEEEAINALAAAYETNSVEISSKTDDEFKAYLKTLGIEDEKLINSLAANRSETERLCKEINENKSAVKELNQTILSSALMNNEDVQNSDYKDEIIATASETFEKDKQAKLKQLQDSGFGTKKVGLTSGKNDKQAKAYAEEYAKAAGLGNITLTGVTGNDKNRRYKMKTEDGKEIEVDVDTMMDTIATNTAKEKAQGAQVKGNLADSKLKELESSGWGTRGVNGWGSGKKDDDANAVFNEYVKAAGLENVSLHNVKGNDKNRAFVYKDAAGNKHTVSLNDMKQTVAAAYEAENSAGRGTDIAQVYNKLNKQDAAALNAVTNKDYSKLNVSQMKNGFTLDATTITDEDLTKMGYSREEFTNMQAAVQTAAQQEWTNLLNTHTKGAKQAMEAIADSQVEGLKTLSSGALDAYGTMLEGFGDSESMTNFNTALTDIIGANSEHAEEIIQAATNIDWSQGSVALDQFNGQLYDMGINIDNGNSLWDSFATAVNNISFSVVNSNVDKLRENLSTISKIAKDIKMGDVISDDDYAQLTAIDGSLKKDFVMTADGYMYVGEKDLKSSASAASIAELSKTKNNNKTATAAYNALQTGVFANEDWRGLIEGTDGDAASISMASALKADTNITKALGVDAEYIDNLITAMQGTDTGAQDAAREKLQALYSDIQTLENNYKTGAYDDSRAEEIVASQLGLNDLQAAYNKGSISKDVYNTFAKVLQKKAEEVELEEAERYHDINRELEKQEQLLSRINNLKESAFSKNNYAQLIKMEAKALADAAQEQQNYVDEASANAIADGKKLKDYQGGKNAQGEDVKFKYDETGNITNYDTVYSDIYDTQLKAYNQAKKDLALGNISQDKYDEIEKTFNKFVEDTSNYEDTLNEYANAQTDLVDKNNQYYTYLVTSYTDTLAQASEEIDKYTARLEHQGKKLEHYKNLISLTGQENNYKALDTVLSGQAKLAHNNLNISKDLAKTYTNEAKKYEDLMNAAKDAGNNELFEVYRQRWEEAAAKSREAEDQMLSDLQSWAESEKAILENTLADLGKSLEETLTGGKSFDEVSTQLERAQSLQEEYLTTTNQIYETTKMMRTAQQAIDASSNTIAKDKLKNFITETKNLQEQGKLSQYELDMQQAKYDLLVAEIALEEAKNAKSTVRLQRDAEGNFGYVYTADAGAVADAQQKFDDAQNTLYNKGLDGANDYAQKYQQTMSEMTSTLQEIQSNYLAGSYASEEEYQMAMTEARSYYTQQLQTYSDLYGVATKDNTDIINEAWSSSCDIMTTSVTDVAAAVDAYMQGANAAFEKWQSVVTSVQETTGKDLAAITANVKAVTDVSDGLANSLTGENGVIEKLKTGFTEVGDIIKDALSTWAGLTVSVDTDGNLTFGNNTALPDDSSGGAASGGLTSAWGPEGKLLTVHESELILNKDETSQFFAHLNAMESILSTLDFYAASQQYGGILSSPSYAGSNSGTLEQNVKIEASFPGVTDRNEIEEAFNNLVNKASQYANRK